MKHIYLLGNENIFKMIKGDTLFVKHMEGVRTDNCPHSPEENISTEWDSTTIKTTEDAIRYYHGVAEGYDYYELYTVDMEKKTVSSRVKNINSAEIHEETFPLNYSLESIIEKMNKIGGTEEDGIIKTESTELSTEAFDFVESAIVKAYSENDKATNRTLLVDFQSVWEEGTAEGAATLDVDTGEVFDIGEGEITLNGEDELEILMNQEIYINNKSYTVIDNEDETGYAYCVSKEDAEKIRQSLIRAYYNADLVGEGDGRDFGVEIRKESTDEVEYVFLETEAKAESKAKQINAMGAFEWSAIEGLLQ